jgi:hypothetical protein
MFKKMEVIKCDDEIVEISYTYKYGSLRKRYAAEDRINKKVRMR